MKKIQINDKEYQLPANWSELNKGQLFNVCYARLALHNSNSDTDFYSLSVSIFIQLAKIPFRTYLRIDAGQWADMIPHVRWIFDKPDLRTNLLWRVPGRRIPFRLTHYLYGPKGLLDECTFEEFTEADTIFESYNKLRNMDSLWLLMAVLYRPMRSDLDKYRSSAEWNGDVREPYNAERAKTRATFLKHRLPEYYAVATLLYFMSARSVKLTNNHRLRILFEGSGSSGTGAGWLDTQLEMSNTKFGSMSETKSENWLIVLYEMARQKEIAKQLKKPK